MAFKDNSTKYWDKIGRSYSDNWTSSAKSVLSEKETGFITKYLKHVNPKTVLDIGIGTGRILDCHLRYPGIRSVYGLDLSQSMIKYCQSKYKNNRRIKVLKRCDISREKIPYKSKFDFITAIRVLNYNKNWKENIIKISKSLSKKGVFIFTMPNRHSINWLYKAKIPNYKTTPSKLKDFCRSNNLNILEMTTFSAMPDFLYDRFNSTLINISESFFRKIFGKLLFGRVLFIVVRL